MKLDKSTRSPQTTTARRQSSPTDMTTNRTLESDLKFTKLNNLNKITVTDEWLTNIINAARAYMVNEIVTVGEGEAARPGVKLDRGNLFLLLKARVFQDEEGDFPNGDEEVRYGPYTTDEDGHYTGTAWSESFTASMEQTLWSMCYAALGDAMRTRMTKKFDKERTGGGPPLGTELLRFIQSKTQMLDARVQERKAKKDFDKHAASNMPDGVTTEEMDTWCDTLVALNEKRDNPAEEHELIELTIEAFPESIFDKIEAAHEHHAEHEDYDAARAVWAGVIERHAGREDKRAADKAMRAAEAPPAPAAPVVDAQVAALTKQVEALTALVTKVCVPVGANADSAAVAAAVAAAAATKTNTNPVQPCCGRRHAGTTADCWFLHPNLVPANLQSMLKNIHKRRAEKGLEDLSKKYPAPRE